LVFRRALSRSPRSPAKAQSEFDKDLEMISAARCSSLGRKWLAAASFTGVVMFALSVSWFARAPILRGAAQAWIVSDSIAPADAIAVLGGGLETRPFAAAELYKEGIAPRILVSDVKPRPAEKLGIVSSHVEGNRGVLLKLGVPAQAISGFGAEVSTTYDEARALSDWAARSGAHRVIVPTELFASRRVRWILNKQLGQVGAQAEIQALPPLEYGIDDWWKDERGIITFQNEIIKYLYYRVRY
jgi:uncharacterized SAM-binding protein YcdF (DUF218 family)